MGLFYFIGKWILPLKMILEAKLVSDSDEKFQSERFSAKIENKIVQDRKEKVWFDYDKNVGRTRDHICYYSCTKYLKYYNYNNITI